MWLIKFLGLAWHLSILGPNLKILFHTHYCTLCILRARLDWAETTETCLCVSAFFFFTCNRSIFFSIHLLLRLLFINSSRKVWLFSHFQHKFHCSWTHKFHFLAIFSLKMGPTLLFTHLKIILLQYFSVFSFSF